MAARKVVYGEAVVFSGPRVASVTLAISAGAGAGDSAAGAVVKVAYAAVGTEGVGIVLRSRLGFEATAAPDPAGVDHGVWVAGNVTGSSADSVTVAFAGLAQVAQVRYAYADGPSVFTGTGPAVYNAAGLPATPGLYNVTSF